MGAAAATLKATRVSSDVTNAELPLLDKAISGEVPARSQLIETIKSNVMAWTSWKSFKGVNKPARLTQTGRV